MLYFLGNRLRLIFILIFLFLPTLSFAENLDGILVSQFDFGFHVRSNSTPASCTLPWGGTLGSGLNVTAYSSTLPLGPCSGVSEVRTCTSGALSGSYINDSCLNGCTSTPWGSVSHGYSGTAYQSSTPAGLCTSYDETRSCSNGTMSGSYTATTCANGCSLPWGGYTSSGTSTTMYSSAAPAGLCTSYDLSRTCTNGTLSGSATYNQQNCANGCSLPWGGYTTSGTTVTMYSTSTPTGLCTAVDQARTCTNGTLSGSGTYNQQSCTSGCTYPWGGTMTSGTSYTAYQSATPSGSCTSESRVCTNGSMSGSYTVQNCNAGCPTYGLLHGGSVTGYAATSAGSAAACGSKGTRTCSNGTAGGSGGQYSTCQFPTNVVTNCADTNPGGYPGILNWTTVQGWYKAKGRCGDPSGMQYWSDEVTSLGTTAAKANFDGSWPGNFASCGGTHAACLCGSSSYTYSNGSTTSVCIKP